MGIEPTSTGLRDRCKSQHLLPTRAMLRAHLRPAAMSSRPLESNQNLLLFKRTRRPHTPERDGSTGRADSCFLPPARCSLERRPDAPSSFTIQLSTSSTPPVSSALARALWLGTRVTCTAVVVAAPAQPPVRSDPGQGFEPRLPGPEPGVLPLDEPGMSCPRRDSNPHLSG